MARLVPAGYAIDSWLRDLPEDVLTVYGMRCIDRFVYESACRGELIVFARRLSESIGKRLTYDELLQLYFRIEPREFSLEALFQPKKYDPPYMVAIVPRHTRADAKSYIFPFVEFDEVEVETAGKRLRSEISQQLREAWDKSNGNEVRCYELIQSYGMQNVTGWKKGDDLVAAIEGKRKEVPHANLGIVRSAVKWAEQDEHLVRVVEHQSASEQSFAMPRPNAGAKKHREFAETLRKSGQKLNREEFRGRCKKEFGSSARINFADDAYKQVFGQGRRGRPKTM